jgi:hypothetical protein
VVSSSTYTYSWTLTSKPTGSTATLASTTAASPSFKADVAGAYVATMTITDGSSNVATSSVTLTACSASSNSSSPFSGCTSTGGDVSNASATVSGVASAGAPISGAYINVLSANGKYYSPSATTGADGTFQFTLNTSSYPTPLMVQINKIAGQSIGTYYAYAYGSDLSGLVISPLSNAVLGLAADTNLDQLFAGGAIPATLTTNAIASALQLVAKALSNQMVSLNISDPALLLKNANYVANGSGQDAVLDAVSINTANTDNGSLVISSKLTGVSVQLDNGATAASITSIPFSTNAGNLLASLNQQINLVNTCVKNAVNLNSSTAPCMDANFLDAGSNASSFISNIKNYVGSISSIGNASISWCTLDTPELTFNNTPASLSRQTGICNSTFEVSTSTTTQAANSNYKFTINSAGTAVEEVKMNGNQLNGMLEIKPLIWVKTRVDGFGNNTGITSGYAFNIGTALQQTTGNPIVLAKSNLSAKVEILNSAGANISTLYMQCVQGSNCIDSNLTLCKLSSPTCSNGLNTTADMVLSVNTPLSKNIIEAKRYGYVSARVTAYNKILSDSAKSINFVKEIPISRIPIAQEIADTLIYPAMTSSSATALANWAGNSNLSLTFSRGSQKISLYGINFSIEPRAGFASVNSIITGTTTAADFTGLASRNNGSIIGLTACSSSTYNYSTTASWRSTYFYGSFKNTDVLVKTFGSCNSGDY